MEESKSRHSLGSFFLIFVNLIYLRLSAPSSHIKPIGQCHPEIPDNKKWKNQNQDRHHKSLNTMILKQHLLGELIHFISMFIIKQNGLRFGLGSFYNFT